MKWYSHPTYRKHQFDIKHYNRGIGRYYEWVLKIANTFSRGYDSIGVLNVNDLVQAGHIGLVEAWANIDWERIHNSGNPDAELWSFLKRRIKGSIRREIDNNGAFIKIPRRDIENCRKNLNATDKILVNLFPQFFDAQFPNMIEEITPWDQLELADVIDDYMIKTIKNADHREIVKAMYGIDIQKRSVKELAEKYRMSEISIKKIRERTIKKLRTEEFEKIIENFYENLYT